MQSLPPPQSTLINFIRKITLINYQTMKQHPLKGSNYKFNFRYTNSPSRQQRESLHAVPLGQHNQQVSFHKIEPCQFSAGKGMQGLGNGEVTLKKEGIALEAVTLRKDRNEDSELLEHSQHPSVRSTEATLLKEEIKYMRKKLDQAENAEKELRLEFELYKASTEQGHVNQHQSSQVQSLQQKLIERDAAIQRLQQQCKTLHVQLAQQSKKSQCLQRQLKQRSDQAKQLTIQTREMFNQIQQRCADLNHLNQQLINACHSNEHLFTQNNYLKEVLAQKEMSVAEVELRGKEKEETVVMLREKCLGFQEKVCVLEGEIEKMADRVNQVRMHSEASLHRLEREGDSIAHLQEQLKEMTQAREKLETAKEFNDRQHARERSILQAETLRIRSQNQLLSSNLSTLLSNQRIMLSQIQWLRQQLNAQVERYEATFRTLQEKHHKELEEVQRNHSFALVQSQQYVGELEGQIRQYQVDKDEMAANYQQNFNRIQAIHEMQLQTAKQVCEEEYQKKLKENSSSKIKAQSLSSQQLHKHLSFLKGQNEPQPDQQSLTLKHQNQMIKQQLQLAKIAHQVELQHLKERYQAQIRMNNDEYTHQLSIYMKEVEILMEEMDRIKEKKDYCQDVIEEEPEEMEYDDQKIKNDLKMYSEDSSDFYMSPPSNTPTKVSPNPNPNPAYALGQIIDLDSKINSYIANFNKMKQAQQQQDLNDL